MSTTLSFRPAISPPITRRLSGMLTLFLALSVSALAQNQQEERVDFERDVAPILETHCVRCHNPTNREGDLSLATDEDLREYGYVVEGFPEDSFLLETVRASNGEPPRMPKEGKPLADKQVQTLALWIAQGAKWPDEFVVTERPDADKSFWSLQPLKNVEPPAVDSAPESWKIHPIDRFVYAKLGEQGLRPNPPADRRSLIRRATYDLTGLPPTPEEIEQFVNDQSQHAYEALIDRLLASPRYGERWGRHWLDVARFGESVGYERNRIIDTLWPYRDYVIRSLNEDKPFDRFVVEQLAGDVVGAGDPNVEIGTAFLVCGPYDDVKNQDPKAQAVIRSNEIDDMVRATSEAFLGLTVGCARCHDHKFDPIEQKDYYRMVAAFGGVHHGTRPIATPKQRQAYRDQREPWERKQKELQSLQADLRQKIRRRADENAATHAKRWVRPKIDHTGTEEVFEPVIAKFVRLSVADKTTRWNAKFFLDEFEIYSGDSSSRNVALLSSGGSASGMTQTAEDFTAGYSLERAIDGDFNTRAAVTGNRATFQLAEPAAIGRIVFSSDRLKQVDENNGRVAFAAEYQIHVSLDGRNWDLVADSSDREPFNDRIRRQRLFDAEVTEAERRQLDRIEAELAEIDRQLDAVEEPPEWYAGTFQLPEDPQFHVFLGGNPQRQGPPVQPASLSVLSEVVDDYRLPVDVAEGERRLALANWIVSDQNPLTPRVLANRLWHYHFGTGIVATPSDFGFMGSRPSHPELLEWLAAQIRRHGWRLKPIHREIMLSQTYRQSSQYRKEAATIDSESRLLWRFPPRRLQAEEVRDTVLQVAGQLNLKMGGPGFRLYRYTRDNVATYFPLDQHGPETYRRAVYHQNARAAFVDLLAEFDCPENAFAAPRRASTTTPLQALTLLNHGFTLDMSRLLADRLTAEAEASNVDGQVDRAFRLCYGRAPEEGELADARRLIRQHGLPAFCRAMLNSTELIYLD